MEVRVNDGPQSTSSALWWIILALLLFGVLMRFLPHPANLAPVGAIALFGGALLPRKLAWWLPVVVMIISDFFIGFYNGIAFTWAGFALIGLFGMSLRRLPLLGQIGLGAVGSSLIFFAVSNFGVWLQGQMYALTWSGLAQCYAMALPFLRNTFVGDMLYTSVLFGTYALSARHILKPAATAETLNSK